MASDKLQVFNQECASIEGLGQRGNQGCNTADRWLVLRWSRLAGLLHNVMLDVS